MCPATSCPCFSLIKSRTTIVKKSGFLLVDSEHFLCKIWLAIIHAHASRNVSESKKYHKAHCYPLADQGEWEAEISPMVQQMWSAYVQCAERLEEGCGEYPVYPRRYLLCP